LALPGGVMEPIRHTILHN